MNYIEIDTQETLISLLKSKSEFSKYAFKNLDFKKIDPSLIDKIFTDCFFLGCQLPEHLICGVYSKNYLFPKLNMPYNSYINSLYSKDDLYDNYKLGKPKSYKETLDYKIYEHFINTGKEANDIRETLTRSLHDHAITDALYDFLEDYPDDKKVAIMGGHSLSRADEGFKTVALISKNLTEKGYLLLSGGGPKNENELFDAISILSEAPSYKDELWLDKSFEVLNKYPTTDFESVGIPTWLYGHEPPTPFATKIAKYFANSVREDGLLAIAKGGIVFTPGSAGTIQEIFQDATQNHYLSFDVSSPMIFLDTQYWTEERPVYPLIKKMNSEKKYSNLLLSICDTKEDVIKHIESFNIKKED